MGWKTLADTLKPGDKVAVCYPRYGYEEWFQGEVEEVIGTRQNILLAGKRLFDWNGFAAYGEPSWRKAHRIFPLTEETRALIGLSEAREDVARLARRVQCKAYSSNDETVLRALYRTLIEFLSETPMREGADTRRWE